jgi:hypothetical protein
LKQATSKKARLDDQYGSSPDQHGSGIEKNPIVLKDKPFLYISSWEIAVEEENIRNFRKMVETFNFFPTVRADDTGYFFIFDDTPEGDRLAEDCYDRLKGWRFRKQRMNMKLYKIGEEREHYL